MGFLGLFGKGPLSDKKIARVAKLAANPFAQPDVRMRELQRLLDDGSPAALRGALKRFAANAQGHIADEDEKKWLEDALVAHGDAALAPLRDYIGSQDKLTYALRAYQRIAGEAEGVALFSAVLARYGADDYRSGDAKLQLVWQLGESLARPEAIEALLPFLADHSDDVRWAVLDLIERAAGASAAATAALAPRALPTLAPLVCTGEVSSRIARRAADVLCQLGWSLPEAADGLVAGLDDAYFLDKKRVVRRRGRAVVA